jgi:hypothetical protein
MATPSDRPLRITRLELRNWRNFPRADLDLELRTFLVGPNASGKSNLLDSIRFLHDIVAIGGGFEEAVTSRGGVSSIRSLAARRNPDIKLTVHLGSEVSAPQWEYELSLGQTAQRRPVIKQERVVGGGKQLLSRPDEHDEADPARLSQTFLEQVNVNRSFRPIADFLRTVRYKHIVPQLIREPDRSVGKKDDPYGGISWSRSRTPLRKPGERASAASAMRSLLRSRSFRTLSSIRTRGVCITSEDATNTGVLEAPGNPRAISLMERSVCWGFFGQCSMALGRYCWRSPSFPCIRKSFATSPRCWPECRRGRGARSSSVRSRLTSSRTRGSDWTRYFCSYRDPRVPRFGQQVRSRKFPPFLTVDLAWARP